MREMTSVDQKPVSLTSEAKTQLISWGLREYLDELVDMTGGYKYSAAGKVEQITTVFRTDEDGDAFIVVPHFFDPMGKPTGGECSDIAALFDFHMRTTGLLQDLKTSSSEPLDFLKASGNSRTHFPDANHVFNVLTRGPREFASPMNTVVFDASFREISTVPENGYHIHRVHSEKENTSFIHGEVEIVPAQRENDGNLRIKSDIDDFLTLGLSRTGNLVYGLLFLGDQFGNYQPAIKIIFPNGKSLNCHLGENGSMHFMGSRPPVGTIETADTEEIQGMLQMLQQISVADELPKHIDPTHMMRKY